MVPTNCWKRKCKHFKWHAADCDPTTCGGIHGTVPAYCTAFPNGIPAEIAYGENPHEDFCPGDHGLCYEYAGDEAGVEAYV